MNKRRATRNMITAIILIAVVVIGGIAAISSVRLVLSLPR
jgi:small-conductance mechanosensitive channel